MSPEESHSSRQSIYCPPMRPTGPEPAMKFFRPFPRSPYSPMFGIGFAARVGQWAARSRRIARSRDGAVAVHVALTLSVLLGMAGLAIDVGFAFYKLRQMQAAADAAAFSAAIARSTGAPADFTTEAYAVAGQNGFVNGANGVTVAVNSPPTSPPATAADAANVSAVQVIIQQPQSLSLASLVSSGGFNLNAQAVAAPSTAAACDPSSPDSVCACVLQLNATASPGVAIGAGATVGLNGCGMQVCSGAGPALTLSGGAELNLMDASGTMLTDQSQTVSIVGGTSFSDGATNNGYGFCFSCVTIPACAASADPYAQIPNPTAPGGCSLGTGVSYALRPGNPAYTLSPGVWCAGVTFGESQTYQLNPGVYYVDGGTFAVQEGATLNGTGVTIVLTGEGGDYATIDIAAGATVNLSAPTSGTTSGIVFFGDESAPSTNVNTFENGASVDVTGAIYFPTQEVIMSNGSSNASSCTQLIAATIQFTGDATFSRNCSGTGTAPIGATTGPVVLTE